MKMPNDDLDYIKIIALFYLLWFCASAVLGLWLVKAV